MMVSRGLLPIEADCLPVIGMIEPGVAVGFLARTDAPGVAFLDGFVSHAGASSEERGAALTGIAAALCDRARDLGVRHVLIYSHHATVLQWAEQHGFVHRGMDVLLSTEG